MCLGIPGQVVEVVDERGVKMGRVQFGAIHKPVCFEYLPDVQPGEWVLVHVGFALSKVDEREAERIFALLSELDALEDQEPSP